MKNITFFLLLFLIHHNKISKATELTTEIKLEDTNKIVCLISPPRSMSTAFLRMMEARGDFEVMLEPSIHLGKVIGNKKLEDLILEKSIKSNTFLKELTSTTGFLYENTNFLKRKNVYCIFLVRNPHDQIISNYKKMINSEVGQGKQLVSTESYKLVKKMFDFTKKNSFNNPCIVLAENLSINPISTYNQLCNFLNITHKQEALSWQPLGESFNADTWNALKPVHAAQHWQGTAINSSGFHALTKYKVDENGNPTFEEIDENRRDKAKQVYIESLALYNQMLTDNVTDILNLAK